MQMHLMETILKVEDAPQAIQSLLVDEIFDDGYRKTIVFGLAIHVSVVYY